MPTDLIRMLHPSHPITPAPNPQSQSQPTSPPMSKSSQAIAICRREGLSYAGPRSARLAACLYRFNRRWSRRRATGRPLDLMLARVRRLAKAYRAAMESDYSHPI